MVLPRLQQRPSQNDSGCGKATLPVLVKELSSIRMKSIAGSYAPLRSWGTVLTRLDGLPPTSTSPESTCRKSSRYSKKGRSRDGKLRLRPAATSIFERLSGSTSNKSTSRFPFLTDVIVISIALAAASLDFRRLSLCQGSY
jgi:hypothetical protein